MLKLYGGKGTRAGIIQWYLEEKNIPYEYIELSLKDEEHKEETYLKINPMGKVPSLLDEDFVLWESGAILLYLAEKYGNEVNSIEQRALLNQWILFGNSTLTMGLFVEANRERDMPKLLGPLNAILEKQSFLLGNDFSVADVAVGSILGFMVMMFKFDFSDYPAVMDYIKRLSDRPAFQKAMAR